jgi:hypothetical protein
MMHYHLAVEVFAILGTMVDPECRHSFLVEVDEDEFFLSRKVVNISTSDREAVIKEAIEEAACDFLHDRKMLGVSLVAALNTRRAIVRGDMPARNPDISKAGFKLWYSVNK